MSVARVLMSENRLAIELSSIRLVNRMGMRTPVRDVEVGFLVTGWQTADSGGGVGSEVPLIEMVETVHIEDVKNTNPNKQVRTAGCHLASRLTKLAKELEAVPSPQPTGEQPAG